MKIENHSRVARVVRRAFHWIKLAMTYRDMGNRRKMREMALEYRQEIGSLSW